MKIAFVRSVLALSFPFVIAWAMASTFCTEIGRAFRYTWLEAKIETESFRKIWRKIPESFDA